MADEETMVNGVALEENEDKTAENETKLSQKIEALENEKILLVKENEGVKDQVVKLTAEIELLRSKESDAEAQKKALDAVAARASQLETEVSRLQHDLISAMSAEDEANNEIRELKKIIGEKETDIEEVKKEKVEIERKVRELERKIGVLEVKEIEERSKRVRIEEEMREKIDEKEKEVFAYKNKFLELENNSAKKLEKSEERAREIEGKVAEMQKKLEETEKMKERSLEGVNGIGGESTEKEYKKMMDWPVIALGSTGAIVAALAVGYVCCARRS
ncbi:peroxisomal and mitochondrial division factor 1 [Ricinus communis]|uniref:peroxisomal and mitochondrial division factor 1 n=1 Tax=Ricinus communis TaxID=3988 RepID=UPI00201A4D3C|nr:peroxisomal and mitochondrial division factor 1 [Ricinus communis]